MKRQPTFLWQGTLIILPVLLLAAAGIVSLWQDRASVTAAARLAAEGQAAQIAASLGSELESELRLLDREPPPFPLLWPTGAVGENDQGLFLIRRETIDRHSFPSAPVPMPLPLEQLADKVAELWSSARAAENHGSQEAVDAYSRFLASDPPEPFRSNAAYARALHLLAIGEVPRAIEGFEEVSQFQALTESGFSLRLLAGYQRLVIHADQVRQGESEAESALFAAAAYFGSHTIWEPCSLSEPLLRSAAEKLAGLNHSSEYIIDYYRKHWATEERTQAFFQSIRSDIDPAVAPFAFWADREESAWFVLFSAGSEGDVPFEIMIHPAETVREVVAQLLERSSVRLPSYLEPVITLAARPLSPGEIDGSSLARAEAAWPGDPSAAGFLRVDLFLADPDLLYAQQRGRALLFGSLILLAAATALVGFATAHRAFRRQLSLNELKSNFVASVSHELRAPIASVRLMAEGLERGAVREPEQQQGYYRFIVQECRRLSSLIENVLDFSRIEQGRREYAFEPTDLVALVRHTAGMMQPYADERQQRIAVRIDPDLSPNHLQPELDGKAMQQALVNLIDNAIKHSPPGETIEVEVQTDTDIGAILLSVTDHGEGIPAEEHKRIFERFYRLGSELRRETEGAGIGLSIVKHIVEAHHGSIRVQSTPDQFTRFTIHLPLTSPPPIAH